MADQQTTIKNIKMLIMDVDGVLTDGSLIINHDSTESKVFNVLDGHGIAMWHRAGFQTAIISGRHTDSTEIRAKQLGIGHVMQGCKDKLVVYQQLLEKVNLKTQETAYIGDDVIDIPIIKRAGFGVAVSNAADEVKHAASYVTNKAGGTGAVREVIEYLLKTSGKWDELMQKYLV